MVSSFIFELLLILPYIHTYIIQPSYCNDLNSQRSIKTICMIKHFSYTSVSLYFCISESKWFQEHKHISKGLYKNTFADAISRTLHRGSVHGAHSHSHGIVRGRWPHRALDGSSSTDLSLSSKIPSAMGLLKLIDSRTQIRAIVRDTMVFYGVKNGPAWLLVGS